MIDCYTAPTPNGWKVTVCLEELNVPYRVHAIDLGKAEQKTEDFIKMNPNGRIPVIVDHSNDGHVLFESGAIMLYLAERSKELLGETEHDRYQVIQWLIFQMSGIGPMMGQANVFYRYFPEKIQPAIDRYQNECRRLFEVLNGALSGRQYLVGNGDGIYSIADIANWCWVSTHQWSGVDIQGLDHLSEWLERIRARPAVKIGTAQPKRPKSSDITKTGSRIITK